jgi:hypothetical protein
MAEHEDTRAEALKARTRKYWQRQIAEKTPEELAAFRAAAAERTKAWTRDNPDKVEAYRERRNALKRARRAANPEKTKADRKRHAASNRDEKLAARRAKHAAMTPEQQTKVAEGKRRYRQENREKVAAAKAKWDAENAEHRKEYTEAYKERRKVVRGYRLKTDPRAALNHRMSCLVRNTLKGRGGRKGSKRWEELVGYTIADLERHLRRTIPDGLTWDDFMAGRLHIEHKTPLSAFNFTDPSHIDFRRAWALSNLRLWPGPDNLKKHAKLEKPFQPSLAL